MEPITQGEIDKEKERLRKLGIGKFTISGMSEDESIASDLRARYSTKYAAVLDPYFNVSRARQRKNIRKAFRFRIFKLDPEKPGIPMGYSGMPIVTFESHAEDPRDIAIREIKKSIKGSEQYKTEKPGGYSNDLVVFRRKEQENENTEIQGTGIEGNARAAQEKRNSSQNG